MSGSKCTLWTPRVTFLPTWRSPNLIRRVNTTWWFYWRILMLDGPGSQPEKPKASRMFQNPIWCNQRHRRQRTHEGQRSCGCLSNMVQAGLEVPGTFQRDLGLTFQCGAIRPIHYSRAGASQAREYWQQINLLIGASISPYTFELSNAYFVYEE